MNSEESRQSNLSRLYASFRSADGQYFEADVNQSELPTGAAGKTLVTFSANLPSAVDASSLQLYIGQAVAGGKLTTAGTEAAGYVNTAALALNVKTITPQTNLSSGISMFPYTLAVSNSSASLTAGATNLTLSVNYSLTQDSTYQTGAYGHKLVLQFIDPFGQLFEKTLTFGTDLIPGTSSLYTTTISSTLFKSLSGGNYRLKLYDEFQGQRMELGSQIYDITVTQPAVSTDSDKDSDKDKDTGTASDASTGSTS